MKRTWLAGTVAGMCVTVASVVTGGVPASADVNDCRDGYVCVWGDSNYRGRYLFSATDVHNVGERMNDLTTSLWNRTGSKVCFFDDASWSGAPCCTWPRARGSRMSEMRPMIESPHGIPAKDCPVIPGGSAHGGQRHRSAGSPAAVRDGREAADQGEGPQAHHRHGRPRLVRPGPVVVLVQLRRVRVAQWAQGAGGRDRGREAADCGA